MMSSLFVAYFLWMALFAAKSYGESNINDLSKATAEFALDILKANGNSDQSAIFSPASISTCVGMVYLGSSGATKSQINKAVFNGLKDDDINEQVRTLSDGLNTPSTSYNLSIANRVYAKQNFEILPDYISKLQNYYQTGIKTVDFAHQSQEIAGEINQWVESRTNSKIRNLVSSNSLANIVLLLVNAIYFKGDWSSKFDEKLTLKKTFYMSQDGQTEVDMMKQTGVSFYYSENDNVQVLGMPYKSDQLAMYVVLPKNRDDLAQIESKLNGDSFLQLIQNSRETKLAEVQIPKFKLEKQLQLVNVLKSLGMTDMFNKNVANFTGIDGKNDLYVSDAIHKAFIEVNEKGSEAAAATAVHMMSRMASVNLEPKYRFIADHPFLFSIVDRRTLNVLFFGRYTGK